MKIVVMFIAAFVAAVPVVRAAENPDKYPSVGFSYAETRVSDVGGGSFVAARPITLDLRIPTSDNVTLGFMAGQARVGTSSRDVRNGYTVGASARVYLPFRLVRN